MLKIKIKKYMTFPRILAASGLVLLIVFSMTHHIAAQSVIEGFKTDDTLQRGMIVTLDKKDSSKVVAVKLDNSDHMKGVVVNASEAPVTIAGDNQKTFVADSGQYEVFVSNENGTIATGDYLSASGLAGIGMKADTQQEYIIGKAVASFDGKSNVISTTKVTNSDKSTITVAIGRIKVDVGATVNPLAKSNSNVPAFLVSAGRVITHKQVSAAKIYLGLLILIVCTGIVMTMLYTGVKGALTAIGRNPLSKKTILRGMLQVIVTSLSILAAGIFGVYLLLKL